MQTNFIVDKKQLEISLENVDAISLNGKKLSNPMTKAEYEAIAVKDPNTIYLIEETETITAVIPDYSTSDANKILAVNASGTALAWINAPTGEGGSGLTVEQINQLQTAYEHSQSSHVQASDIPNISNLQPKTDNTLATTNKTIVGAINEIKNLQENSGTGMTPEQTSQLQTAYEHSQSEHASVADLNTIKENLNGKKIIGPITKTEYENIAVKDPNALYLIEETETIAHIPDYSTSDANKILAVNASGTALAWINAPTGEGGSGLTVEQLNQLQAAYQHSQSTHVQASDISGLQPKTDNTLATTNKTIVGAINEIKNSITSEIPVYSSSDIGKVLAVDSSGSSLTWVEASNTGNLSMRDIVDGEIFIAAKKNEPGQEPIDESMVLFVNNSLSKEATAEDKTNILVDHTNNHIVKAVSANANSSFVPKIISDDGTAIQFVSGGDTGKLTVLNSGKLTSLNNTVEIYFESTADIGSGLISIYDNRGLTTNNSGGQQLRIANNRIVLGDGGPLYIDIPATIEPNIKYHLVTVSDSDNKKAYIYLNGVKLTENTVNSLYEIKEHDVGLGDPSQGNIKYYYFKVYNRALSESEIQTKYEGVN